MTIGFPSTVRNNYLTIYGAQNDHPIGNLNARYRCFPVKPFHDFPPGFNQRPTGTRRRAWCQLGAAAGFAAQAAALKTKMARDFDAPSLKLSTSVPEFDRIVRRCAA